MASTTLHGGHERLMRTAWKTALENQRKDLQWLLKTTLDETTRATLTALSGQISTLLENPDATFQELRENHRAGKETLTDLIKHKKISISNFTSEQQEQLQTRPALNKMFSTPIPSQQKAVRSRRRPLPTPPQRTASTDSVIARSSATVDIGLRETVELRESQKFPSTRSSRTTETDLVTAAISASQARQRAELETEEPEIKSLERIIGEYYKDLMKTHPTAKTRADIDTLFKFNIIKDENEIAIHKFIVQKKAKMRGLYEAEGRTIPEELKVAAPQGWMKKHFQFRRTPDEKKLIDAERERQKQQKRQQRSSQQMRSQ